MRWRYFILAWLFVIVGTSLAVLLGAKALAVVQAMGEEADGGSIVLAALCALGTALFLYIAIAGMGGVMSAKRDDR